MHYGENKSQVIGLLGGYSFSVISIFFKKTLVAMCAVMVLAQISACSKQDVLEVKTQGIDVTDGIRMARIETAINLLYAAYQETDPVLRDDLLEQAVTDNVSYWERSGLCESRQALSKVIGESLELNEGYAPKLTGDIQTYQHVARSAWSARRLGAQIIENGESYFELAEDGRLQLIVNFSAPAHHDVFSGGPKAYVQAWNSNGIQERYAALVNHWSSTARWIEKKFDEIGLVAITERMNSKIQLDPVNGVMDVIEFENSNSGSQIRFQVDVTRREDGKVIGTFTDFVSVDAQGKVDRLAGFKGRVKASSPKLARVDPDWNRSYASGYTDQNGQYAGGSEVMHLANHNGKLFAANGYWRDKNFRVPKGDPRQSAQVLRLDESNGRWTVDLDMGVESPSEIDIIKGNILKSITFTKDADGNLLPSPETVLFMAAGNQFTHVMVWVRDDATGKWAHEVVTSGPRQKDVRYVPRDVEVYTDKVTGQERVFLLLGNPGIISGVYDPIRPTKIRWDESVEFPDKGALGVRPLGIVEANGELFFSQGGTLYKRNDGKQPSYSEVINLDEPLNIEFGGIRGLSVIDNPTGSGQSLIFMWVPNESANGSIKRLDPDGRGGYVMHDEISIAKAQGAAMGDGIALGLTLGAYNEFFEVVVPETGEKIHVIGYESVLTGDKSITGPEGYYQGGLYAIRTADQQYRWGYINGRYAPGTAITVAPRTFALSPFGDNKMFIGGNDSNFKESTEMAWIFSASLDVFLAPLTTGKENDE